MSAQQPTTDFTGIDCGILVEDTEARQYVEVDVAGESRAIGGCATIPIRFLVYPTQTTVSDLRIDLELGSTTDPPLQVLGSTPFTADGIAGNGALRYTLTISDLPADDGGPIIAYEYLIYVQSTGGTADGFDALGKVLPVTPAYFSEREMRFLVGELPVGIYFLSIETADGNLYSMPFSVQR